MKSRTDRLPFSLVCVLPQDRTAPMHRATRLDRNLHEMAEFGDSARWFSHKTKTFRLNAKCEMSLLTTPFPLSTVHSAESSTPDGHNTFFGTRRKYTGTSSLLKVSLRTCLNWAGLPFTDHQGTYTLTALAIPVALPAFQT